VQVFAADDIGRHGAAALAAELPTAAQLDLRPGTPCRRWPRATRWPCGCPRRTARGPGQPAAPAGRRAGARLGHPGRAGAPRRDGHRRQQHPPAAGDPPFDAPGDGWSGWCSTSEAG
jgi:hypothetical protein